MAVVRSLLRVLVSNKSLLYPASGNSEHRCVLCGSTGASIFHAIFSDQSQDYNYTWNDDRWTRDRLNVITCAYMYAPMPRTKIQNTILVYRPETP